jgi:hypothetical protein
MVIYFKADSERIPFIPVSRLILASASLRTWKADADCVNNLRDTGNLGSYRFRQVTLLVCVDLACQIYDMTVRLHSQRIGAP